MNDLNKHEIYYNDFLVTISVIGKKKILGNQLSILDIWLNKDNKSSYLGNFYTKLPNVVTEEYMYTLVCNLINNIDDIIFISNRYIGDDINIKNKCKSINSVDLALEKIYEEFIQMPKKSMDYLKYSRFLEIYFNGHPIPDLIRKAYLTKHKKSVLDFFDIDSKIKKDFNCDISELKDEQEYKSNINNLEDLNLRIIDKEKELKIINDMLCDIKNIISIKIENESTTILIEKEENKLKSCSFFSKNRNEIKKTLRNLKSSIVALDLENMRNKIFNDYSSYSEIYGDKRGVLILFDKLSLEDILSLFEDIYSEKLKQYKKFIQKKEELTEKISSYHDISIDISDLYERLESV